MKYILTIIFSLAALSSHSARPDYTLMNQPEEIEITIAGLKHTFKCSYAQKKSRDRFVKATLLQLIFDNMFKMWNVEIPKNKEEAVIKYWLKINSNFIKIAKHAAEYHVEICKYVPHGIELVDNKGMTPQEVYDTYISQKLPRLTAQGWYKYYNVYNRPETIKWMNDYLKATPEKQQLMIFSSNALQSVKLFIMLHKIYNKLISTTRNTPTDASWQKYLNKTFHSEIKSFNIQISSQYQELLSSILSDKRFKTISTKFIEKRRKETEIFIKIIND